jgi:hypothetical protein
VSHQEKSPGGFSTHSAAQIREAEENLTRCLEAYDQRGNQGLGEELNRIHRSGGSRLKRVPMGGPFNESYSQVLMPESQGSSTPTPNGSPK